MFGRPTADLTREKDEEIYNDFDFYQGLLKDFLSSNDVDTGNQGPGNEEDIYLEGADLGMTQKYLEQRKKIKSGLDKKKKEVDRKASKNRKIRYVVHDKLVNFMAPLENLNVLEGKDYILNSLFGQKSASNGH